MSISKRLRYEILRRDDFTCYYCGAKPPGVELTADHVIPVALGGKDEPENLVAACGACNNGKSSSSPGAPTIAAVSDDAFRWSRALAEAAAQMQAQVAGRREIYDQFDGWWGQWTYGSAKLPLPRPAGWESSVDSFLAAGLPLDMLEWCVRRAMASKASPEGTWKYMCGVAWRKVTELQQAARSIAGQPGSARTESDEGSRTPDEYAAHLLKLVTDEDRERAFRDEGKVRDDPADPCDTTEGRTAGAAWFAVSNIVCDRECMRKILEELLNVWPDKRGIAALVSAQKDLEARFGSGFDQNAALINAAWEVLNELQVQDAEAYLGTLPPGGREHWMKRAHEAWGDRDFGFLDSFWITEAADMARKVAR